MATGWMGYVLNVACFVVFVLMLAWYVLLLYGGGCLILGFRLAAIFVWVVCLVVACLFCVMFGWVVRTWCGFVVGLLCCCECYELLFVCSISCSVLLLIAIWWFRCG